MSLHAHELVFATAKKMAEAVYEELAKKNDFYALNPVGETWVQGKIGYFLTQARATLAEMLNGNLPESLKEQIADALVKDASLQRRRAGELQLVRKP